MRTRGPLPFERPELPMRACPRRAALALAVTLAAGLGACAPQKEPVGSGPSASGSSSADPTASPSATPDLGAAVEAYRGYLAGQVDDTIAATQSFADAIRAGDVEAAKALYAPSRVGWESIEPVAATFGDIDAEVDPREADLEDGDDWTGWPRIEKELWVAGSTEGMVPVVETLLTDLEALRGLVPNAWITARSMANGARELMEMANGRITAEAELVSRTDLVDVDANLAGARKIFDLLKPTLDARDPELAAVLTEEFDDVAAALAEYEEGDGYVPYDTVTADQREELSDLVTDLAEPLAELAGTMSS